MKDGGIRIPHCQREEPKQCHLDVFSLCDSSPAEQLWMNGLLGAVRAGLPNHVGVASTDAGLCFQGLHLIETVEHRGHPIGSDKIESSI